MTAFDGARVAELIVGMGGRETRSSGYRVDSNAVLTSRHSVKGASAVKVRFDHHRPSEWEAPATGVWLHPDTGTDVAVVFFDPPSAAPAVEPARYGRLADQGRVEAHAAGFPAFEFDEGRGYRDSHDAYGEVALASGRKSGLIRVHVAGAEMDQPWKGMSGAALWIGELIVGVVIENSRLAGSTWLKATRIEAALRSATAYQGRTLAQVLAVEDVRSLSEAGTSPGAAEIPSRPPNHAITLDAYRIPAGFGADGMGAVDGASLIDERYRGRLDVLVCLPRGGRVTVLADHEDPCLADHLNDVESLILADRRRHWWGIDVDGRPPPAGISALQEMVAGTDRARRTQLTAGSGPGLVLRWKTQHHAARQYRDTLLRLIPDAALVYQLPLDRLDPAISAAARVARELDVPEVLIRPPGLSVAASARRGTVLDTEHPAAALVASLLQEGADRRLLPSAGSSKQADVLPDDVLPDPVAEQVVAELNQLDPWGSAEADVLAAVRELLPRLYPALLSEHARRRTGPGRLAALVVAARTDAEMDLWADAARCALPRPTDPLMLRAMDTRLVDTVGLALLRNNAPAVAAQWLPYMSRPAAAAASFALEHGTGSADERRTATALFLRDASAASAVAALRAGIGAGIGPGAIPSGQVRPGCWALVSRRGVDAETARWLAGLTDAFHRLVGLARDEERSVADRDSLAPLRAALAPALPVS